MSPIIPLLALVLVAPSIGFRENRGKLPEKLDIAWQTDLPGEGLSSPLVIGDKVVVTCSSGPLQDTLHTMCFSVEDGSLIWERTLWATGRVTHHEKGSVAAPSPCSDGEKIFALFSSNDLACYDLDGNLQWLRSLTLDYPNASNSLGLASSPVAMPGALVVQIENDSESFAAGIDLETGENRWKIERTARANWSSPVRLAGNLVGLQGSAGFDAVVASTGETSWSFTGGASTTPSSVESGGVVFVPSGGLTALDLGSGEEIWSKANLSPGTASPVAGGDRVYVINKAGVLTAANAADGSRIWKTRLEGGAFSASPILVGDRMLAVSEREGIVQIIALDGEEAEVIVERKLDAEIQSTPSLSSDGAVFVRSDHKLWKLD